MLDWLDLAADTPHVKVVGGGFHHLPGETLEQVIARDPSELREDLVQFQLPNDVFVDVGWYGPFEDFANGRFNVHMGLTTAEDPFHILETITTRDVSAVAGAARELLDRAERLSDERARASAAR